MADLAALINAHFPMPGYKKKPDSITEARLKAEAEAQEQRQKAEAERKQWRLQSGVRAQTDASTRRPDKLNRPGHKSGLHIPTFRVQDVTDADSWRPRTPLSFENIKWQICSIADIRMQDLVGFRRTRSLARPRQLAMYFCLTSYKQAKASISLPQIGRHFNRDHTTVMHAVRKITDLRIEEDLQVSQWLRELCLRFGLPMPDIGAVPPS